MKKQKMYTYENWWNGEVTLVHATRLVKQGDQPVLVDWSNFTDADAEKIRKKQHELFFGAVAELVQSHQNQFLLRYKASLMKDAFLRDEIRQCRAILFDAPPNQKTVFLTHWGIGLEHQYLTDIQYYVDRTIKKGIDDGLDFVHSPNNRFRLTGMPDSRIYARFVWDYISWLKSPGKQVSTLASVQSASLSIPVSVDYTNADAQYLTKNWFKIGLSFATGQMDDLIEKHMSGTAPNCSAIARSMGDINLRPYISESYYNSSKGDKNIFSNPKKTDYLIDYCERHNHHIASSFMERLYKK